jgi:hypothetical protein
MVCQLLKAKHRCGRRIAVFAQQTDRPGSKVFIVVIDLPQQKLIVQAAHCVQGPQGTELRRNLALTGKHSE